MRRHQLTALGALVRRTAGAWKMGPALEIIRAWPKVAGPLITAHLAPVRYWNGTLFLMADQAVWGHQLPFLAPDLLASYERVLGTAVVKELKLSSYGPLPDLTAAAGPARASGRTPAPPPRPMAAQLPKAETEAIAKEAARFIANPELAERFAAFQQAVKRVQLGRRLSGAKPCTVCRVPHAGPGARCPLCRCDRPPGNR